VHLLYPYSTTTLRRKVKNWLWTTKNWRRNERRTLPRGRVKTWKLRRRTRLKTDQKKCTKFTFFFKLHKSTCFLHVIKQLCKYLYINHIKYLTPIIFLYSGSSFVFYCNKDSYKHDFLGNMKLCETIQML